MVAFLKIFKDSCILEEDKEAPYDSFRSSFTSLIAGYTKNSYSSSTQYNKATPEMFKTAQPSTAVQVQKEEVMCSTCTMQNILNKSYEKILQMCLKLNSMIQITS